MRVRIKDTASSRGQWYAHLIGSTITAHKNDYTSQYAFTADNSAIRIEDTEEIIDVSKEAADLIARTANNLTEKQKRWFRIKVKDTVSSNRLYKDRIGQILDVYKSNDLWYHNYPTGADILVEDCEVLVDITKLDIDQQQFQESTPDEKKEMIKNARQTEPFPGPNAPWPNWTDQTNKLAFPYFKIGDGPIQKVHVPEYHPVNKPAHCTDGKIEVIDFIEDKKLGFHLGNAIKYIARAGKKDPAKTIEDLEKARWYLDREIERLHLNYDNEPVKKI